jgi:hypothetical protein
MGAECIHELAADPALELDISAITHRSVMPPAAYWPFSPEHVLASIYTENTDLPLPFVLSCGNITAPNALTSYLPVLEAMGDGDMPKLRLFHQEELVRAGNISVSSAELFHAHALREAGIIDVTTAMAFFAPELRQVKHVYGGNLMIYEAPFAPPPVDREGRLVDMRANAFRPRPVRPRRVATAIDGDPREPIARADIFAIGGNEYLVPHESRYDGNKLIESIIRLDQAKRIISRPNGSRQIKDMELSSDIPPAVRAVLAQAVETVNSSTFGYTVRIIRPV